MSANSCPREWTWMGWHDDRWVLPLASIMLKEQCITIILTKATIYWRMVEKYGYKLLPVIGNSSGSHSQPSCNLPIKWLKTIQIRRLFFLSFSWASCLQWAQSHRPHRSPQGATQVDNICISNLDVSSTYHRF